MSTVAQDIGRWKPASNALFPVLRSETFVVFRGLWFVFSLDEYRRIFRAAGLAPRHIRVDGTSLKAVLSVVG